MCAGCTDRLITISQIARRFELTRADAETLVSRPGFPAPVGEVTASSPPYSSTPVWRSSHVRNWAAEADTAVAA